MKDETNRALLEFFQMNEVVSVLQKKKKKKQGEKKKEKKSNFVIDVLHIMTKMLLYSDTFFKMTFFRNIHQTIPFFTLFYILYKKKVLESRRFLTELHIFGCISLFLQNICRFFCDKNFVAALAQKLIDGIE